jgi:stage II sporulation protein AA (anti-sigma F factor antagonist)
VTVVDRTAAANHRTDDPVVLEPSAAADEEFASGLRAWVRSSIETDHARVVVDLRDVSGVDAAGVEALLTLDRALRRAGGSLRLRSPSKRTLDVLLMTGLDRLVDYNAPISHL